MDPIEIAVTLELGDIILAVVGGFATWLHHRHAKAARQQRARQHQALIAQQERQHRALAAQQERQHQERMELIRQTQDANCADGLPAEVGARRG